MGWVPPRDAMLHLLLLQCLACLWPSTQRRADNITLPAAAAQRSQGEGGGGGGEDGWCWGRLPIDLALRVSLFAPPAALRLLRADEGLFGRLAALHVRRMVWRLRPDLRLCSLENRRAAAAAHPFWHLALGLRHGPGAGALRLLLRLAHRLWSLVASQIGPRCAVASLFVRQEAGESEALRVALCGGSANATVSFPSLGKGVCVLLRYEATSILSVDDAAVDGCDAPCLVPGAAPRLARTELQERCQHLLPSLLDRPCRVALQLLHMGEAEEEGGLGRARTVAFFSVAGRAAEPDDVRGRQDFFPLGVRGLALRRSDALDLLRMRLDDETAGGEGDNDAPHHAW